MYDKNQKNQNYNSIYTVPRLYTASRTPKG